MGSWWSRAAALGAAFVMVAVVAAGCGPSAPPAQPTAPAAPAKPAATQPAAAQPAASKPQQETRIRLGHTGTTKEVKHTAATRFADLVAQRSNGALKVEVFPAGQLAGDSQQEFQNVASGTMEMTLTGTLWLADTVKDLAILDSETYLLANPKQDVKKLLASDLAKQMWGEVEQKLGIRVLDASYVRAPTILWTRNKPINSLDDMKGLKLRIPNQKVAAAVWSAFGAVTVPTPASEVYVALSQGTVEGVTGPADFVVGQKLHEHLQYGVFVNPKGASVFGFAVNADFFRKLPPDQQKVVQDAANEAGAWAAEESYTAEDRLIADLEKAGMKFLRPNPRPFQEVTWSTVEKLEQDGLWSPGLLKKARQVLGQ